MGYYAGLETYSFLIFLGCIEMQHWKKMGLEGYGLKGCRR